MSVSFTTDRLERFQKVVARYEVKRSALLPALYLAQEQWSFLSDEVMDYVATLLEMPSREVHEAASFYTLFRRKPMGRYCVSVCNNITCTMMGSEKLLDRLKSELQIGAGDVTPDGQFSWLHVQCLGSCATAPVVQVNEEYFENMSEAKLTSLLDELKRDKPDISERHKERSP